jgi:extracellular factor (EF) 3-hydroxypalmitic acid methyl ester biosynthesis protein
MSGGQGEIMVPNEYLSPKIATKSVYPDGFKEAEPNCKESYHFNYPEDFVPFKTSPLVQERKDALTTSSSLTNAEDLNDEFRQVVHGLLQKLIDIRQECDLFDIQNSPTQDQQIAFLQPLKETTYATLTSGFRELWEIARSLKENQYLCNKKFLQNHLLPILAVRPLNRMIYQKPLGYAGDFKMMEHYYLDGFEGDSTFEKLIHRYSLDLPVARANINRRKILGEILSEVSANTNYLKIASIGCGPAVEIFDFLERKKQTQKCFITLLDSEIGALKSLMKKVSENDHLSNVNVTFVQMDILRLLRLAPEYTLLEKHDFIYSSGLFDYFSDKHAKKILNVLFSFLKPGGQLILVNVSENIEDVGFMELLGDWRLNLRTKESMLALADEITCSHKDVFFDFETQKNIYLKIIK